MSFLNRLQVLAAFLVASVLVVGTAMPGQAVDRWNTLPELSPMPSTDLTGYAPVNDIKMYYAVYGSGSPVLLIHGGFGYSDQWADIVADLSKTHEVIVADSRGHGRTGYDGGELHYDQMASDYLALLDFLHVQKAAVVGWSDGGDIGLSMAINHPDRVARLFSHSGNATVAGSLAVDYSLPTMTAIVERNTAAYAKLSPTPDKVDAFTAAMTAMWSTEPNWSDDVLSKISVPVTIAIGDHDEMVSLPHNQHMAQVIPGAKFVELKDVSHFAIFQDPEGYLKALHEFLEGY